MDNPVRTAAYRTIMEQRRREVREYLASRLPADAAIIWEVGCGHGHFLTAFAEAHPGSQCVGIDISTDRIERALRKQRRAALPNLHFLQTEARLFIDELPPGLSFEAIFILFPDPWPKLRHQKHRILQPAFLREAAARAAPRCRLYFRTDYLPYHTAAAALVAQDAAWKRVEEPWPFEFETVFQQRAAAHYSFTAQRC